MPLFPTDPRLENLPRIWGSGIFENDAAVAARDHYLELLLEGRDDDDAARMTIEYRWIDVNDLRCRILFWTALAAFQYEVGRLENEVKETVLKLIAAGDSTLFDSNKQWKAQRPLVLAALSDDLQNLYQPRRKEDFEVETYCRKLWDDKYRLHIN